MKRLQLAGMILLLAVVGLTGFSAFAIDEIPEKHMVSRGGVLYPQTGDASQELFQTPANARQMFPPGTLIGVLPADCAAASHGSVGEYYRCDNAFAVKDEILPDGRRVYRVIDVP